jgi:hypothetical protein
VCTTDDASTTEHHVGERSGQCCDRHRSIRDINYSQPTKTNDSAEGRPSAATHGPLRPGALLTL